MIKRMILNSDDFGMTEGVSIGTIHSHTDGILTSTTCLMNMPYTEFALNLAKNTPKLGVGIHLVFTMGRPLIPGVKSFTDEDGNFKKLNNYPEGESKVDLDELYTEWKAQIDKFIELAGKKPTHIDSHHHVHLFSHHQEISIRLAKEYDIPMRQKQPITNHYEFVRCDESFYGDDLTTDAFKSIIQSDDEVLEIMSHPAYVDQRLLDISGYNLPRAKEMEIIRSEKLKKFIQDNKIELITYADLE